MAKEHRCHQNPHWKWVFDCACSFSFSSWMNHYCPLICAWSSMWSELREPHLESLLIILESECCKKITSQMPCFPNILDPIRIFLCCKRMHLPIVFTPPELRKVRSHCIAVKGSRLICLYTPGLWIMSISIKHRKELTGLLWHCRNSVRIDRLSIFISNKVKFLKISTSVFVVFCILPPGRLLAELDIFVVFWVAKRRRWWNNESSSWWYSTCRCR